MKALILLSHGSRMDASNREMMSLADTVADIDGTPFAVVRCAFQQFAQPTFETVVEELIKQEILDLVVCPLFLAAGSHVQVDVPEMVQAARNRYPQMRMTLTPHLGGMRELAPFILKRAMQHAPEE